MDNNLMNINEYIDLNEVDELPNEEKINEGDGVHLEDHKFSGQNTQQLDFTVLLQDAQAFENVFFPPTSMDNSLMNTNEYIDFDELHDLLNNEKLNEGVHFVVGNEGGLSGSHGSNNGELIKAKVKDEQNVKKWPTRKRYEKGSVYAAQMKELHKIRNRESAARAYAQKKTHFLESSLSKDMSPDQLKRTASGPL
ncbi:hypothetical protein DITRI_Ditri13aG0073900 [Diplodiscus trichospermus]